MNENNKMTQEIEIKLDLGSFTNYLKLIGFLGHIEDEIKQINAFFDSNNRKLAKKMGENLQKKSYEKYLDSVVAKNMIEMIEKWQTELE